MTEVNIPHHLVAFIEIEGKLYTGEPGEVELIVDEPDSHGTPSFCVSFAFNSRKVGQGTPLIRTNTSESFDSIRHSLNDAFQTNSDLQAIVGQQAFALREYDGTVEYAQYNLSAGTIVGIVPANNLTAYTFIV